MPKLLFLSRLAFICNICYLLGFMIRLNWVEAQQYFWSIILILGYLPGIIINMGVNFLILFRILVHRKPVGVPAWLAVTNGLFCILQLADLIL